MIHTLYYILLLEMYVFINIFINISLLVNFHLIKRNQWKTRIQDCLFTFEQTTFSVDLVIHVSSLLPWTHFVIISELSFSAIQKCIVFHKQLSLVIWNILAFKNGSNYEPNFMTGVSMFYYVTQRENTELTNLRSTYNPLSV